MVTNAVLHHNTPVLTAQGLFHDLDIYPDHLVIHRTDLLSRLFGTEEVILYNDIKNLIVHDSNFLINNWSQLIIACKNGKTRVLTYGAPKQHIAQHIKETVEDFISRREVAPLMKTDAHA